MSKNKNYKKRRAEQLNMPYGTASNKLRLKVIFDLLRQFDKNYCSKCSGLIVAPESLSVAHHKHWMDEDPALFWKTENIAFMHRECPNVARQETENMSIIEVNITNDNGEKLNHYAHDGQIWIAGNNEEQYNINIRNKTADRIEVVCAVDGRDVISGEVGDYKTESGYVINPYSKYTIRGFRQSNDKVAAFTFSAPGESYSAKMGTPQNVGVIGIAVFLEKRGRFTWTNKTGRVDARHNPWSVDVDYFIPVGTRGGPVDRGVHVNSTTITTLCSSNANDGASLTISSFESGFSAGPASAGPTRGLKNMHKRERKASKRNVSQELGTQYGASVHSSVRNVSFDRDTAHNPNELYTMRYDSAQGLEKRGIDLQHPMGRHEPEAFPGAYVAPGFAQPPPG